MEINLGRSGKSDLLCIDMAVPFGKLWGGVAYRLRSRLGSTTTRIGWFYDFLRMNLGYSGPLW